MEEKDGKKLPDFAQRHIDRDDAYNKGVEDIQKKLQILSEQFRDTVRNLSLGIGAIGAAGLAAMGANIPKNEFLVLAGSFLLIGLSIYSFSYLLINHWKESRNALKSIRADVRSTEDLLNYFDQLIKDGTLIQNLPEYLRREKEFDTTGLGKYTKRDILSGQSEDNMEIHVIVGMVIGCVILAAGFLLPYLCR